MKLSEIQALRDAVIVDSTNVGESKTTTLVIGPPKSGKTHFWCTFPKPIVALYTETNTETADGFIKQCKPGDITLVKLPSTKPGVSEMSDWPFYADQFVPAIKERLLDAKTVVVDNYAGISKAITQYRSALGTKTIEIQTWGWILNSHIDRTNALLSAARPMEGKPSYHIVVTCHLSDDTDKKGNVVGVSPAITGAFKNAIGGKFGSVFLTKSKAEYTQQGNQFVLGKPQHLLYTVPPDDTVACGDGVGGKAGINELPAVIENTYQALCKAWGIEEDK